MTLTHHPDGIPQRREDAGQAWAGRGLRRRGRGGSGRRRPPPARVEGLQCVGRPEGGEEGCHEVYQLQEEEQESPGMNY